jgi:hypothetical protein
MCSLRWLVAERHAEIGTTNTLHSVASTMRPASSRRKIRSHHARRCVPMTITPARSLRAAFTIERTVDTL